MLMEESNGLPMSNDLDILGALPYGLNFKFVDKILSVDKNSLLAQYTFRQDSIFYCDHFIDYPVVPGALIVESMGQAGLVCHAIYLMKPEENCFIPLLTFVNVEFMNVLGFGNECLITGKPVRMRNNYLESEVVLKSGDLIIARMKAGVSLINRK
ncbi:MAG TPA: hypothetical protein PLA77_08210, partial [Bacteroidales bacterium]|nr:hypothetical protein [Bacteroidales bacterium]